MAGVDLGERRTKIVLLDVEGGRPKLVGWVEEPTPPNLFFGGRPVRSVDAAAWLRRLLGQLGQRPAAVVIGVPGVDVQVKRLPVPNCEDREGTLRSLSQNAAFRGAGDGGAGGWKVDYEVIDAGAGIVLAVGARHEGIRAVQAALRGTGFARDAVSVAEVALVNAWTWVTSDPDERVIVVDGGHSAVTVVLVDRGVPAATRRVLFGGQGMEERRGGAVLTLDVASHLIEEWGGRIAQEIRVVVGSALRGAAVEGYPKVVLGGGLSRVRGLDKALADALGSKVEKFAPLGDGAGGEGDGAALGVAWGLAVQGLKPHLGGGGERIVNREEEKEARS